MIGLLILHGTIENSFFFMEQSKMNFLHGTKISQQIFKYQISQQIFKYQIF